MPHLVKVVFHDRSEADRAARELRIPPIPGEEINIDVTEMPSTAEMGRKGGESEGSDAEHDRAELRTGVLIGGTIGFTAGVGIGVLGGALGELAIMRNTDAPLTVASLLTNPSLSAVSGALVGLVIGGFVAWAVETMLARLGAGSPTLVTVKCSEEQLAQVYARLFRTRARQPRDISEPTLA
jgi:hypothetical protein